MKLIVVLVIALAVVSILCSPINSLTIAYDLKCKSNDVNSSMTHYSSLNEQVSYENQNIGLKAESFNYLEDGRIKLDYKFAYNKIADKSRDNTLVFNKMDANFVGRQGIFGLSSDESNASNCVISSSKRAWHESSGFHPRIQALVVCDNYLDKYLVNKSRYNFNGYRLFGNNSIISGNIDAPKFMEINSETIMGPRRNGNMNYGFNYDALVENGTIDIKNTALTAPGIEPDKTDWEQSALITGNIALKNNLTIGL